MSRFTAANRRAGRARVAALEGLDLTLNELATMRGDIVDALKKAIRNGTIRIQADARARAPRATGRLFEAIARTYFDDGAVGSVYVAKMSDPKGGWRPANVPLWLEYGTVKMGARPFLIPAFEAERPRFEAETAELLKDVVPT